MATQIFIDGTLRNDETTGINDDEIPFASLDDLFEAYLLTKGLTAGEAAARDMIDITKDANSSIGDIYFSDSTGAPLSGVRAVDSRSGNALFTTSGLPIYLHSDPDNRDYVLATTGESLDAVGAIIVAAFNIVEGANNLSATIEMVTFVPIQHPDEANPDDDIDWGSALGITATTSMTFSFDNLESGKFTWVAVGSENAGLLVSGSKLNLTADGTRVSGANASDAVNTSQGGAGATIGIDNQMFTPGDSAIFTFVTGLDPLAGTAGQATGQDIDDIQYDGFINTDSATLFISQKQGNGLLSLDLSIYEAGGGTTPEEGRGYASSGQVNVKNDEFDDDTDVLLQSVTIMNGSTEIGTWTTDELAADADPNDKLFFSGDPVSNSPSATKVTITGNLAQVVNVNAFWSVSVKAVDGETFNRFELEAKSGKFDIGNIDVSQGLTTTIPVGLNLLTDDDFPAQNTTVVTVQVDEDESPGGITDEDDETANATISNDALASIINVGADAPASFALNLAVTGAVLNSAGQPVLSQGDALQWSVNATTEVISGVADGRTVFTLTASTTGYAVALLDQIDHANASGEGGMVNINLTPAFLAEDADGDPAALTGSAIVLAVENDVPTAVVNGVVSHEVMEDALPAGNDDGASDTTSALYTNAEMNALINTGADEPVDFSVSLGAVGQAVKTSSGAAVLSKGVAVMWANNSGVLTGMAGDRAVFTVTETAAGFAVELLDQLDHSGVNDDAELIGIDLTPAFDAKDYDGDPAALNPASVILNVENDLPVISSQIQGGVVDFAAASSVTNSLNGSVGGDDDDNFVIDQYADLDGYTEELSADGKSVTYSAGGKDYFRLDVDNAVSGEGNYKFTVLANAPESKSFFDFKDLPSGQNLFGVIAANKAQPDGLGLLVIGSKVDLKADGTFATTSDTINTSKGGGGVTIGNTNQMMDPGEGVTFVFLNNPDDASIAGVGLNQNNADDADTIGFAGTQTALGGEVEVVQVQGGGARKMTLSAYDLPVGSVSTDAESRAFADDTLANAVTVKILTVAVVNSVTGLPVSGASATIDANGIATITGFTAGSTIIYTTDGAHDAVTVGNEAGKWDLGGFNLAIGRDTPDAVANFSVLMTDHDGDDYGAGSSQIFDDFSILIDGTGAFNNTPNPSAPLPPTESFDPPFGPQAAMSMTALHQDYFM